MNDDVTVFLNAEELAARVQTLAAEIDEYYAGAGVNDILVVCILKGSLVFTADLIRQLKTPLQLDFLQVASYDGAVTTGKLKFRNELATDITGRNLLLVEDIIDTGNTLNRVIEKLWEKEPQSIMLCSLLDKPARRTVKLTGDFIGFSIPDYFVVGYGLDYNERYRGLPFLGILKPEVYSK